MTDQHAPRVAGFAGDTVVGTANLDALAARSVQFDAAICASPVCTPSRMCLLTGKDVHHCSAWNNHWVIFPEHTTWPGHFAKYGYTTCLVGKMHFGGSDQMQGFQHRPYGDLRHGLGHQPDPIDLFPAYHGPTLVGETEIPESLLQEHIVTREALSFLEEHHSRTPDNPWFLCASYSRPHSPYTAPGRYIRRYRDKLPPLALPPDYKQRMAPFSQRIYDGEPGRDLTQVESLRAREAYYACVDFVDDCIGDLLDGLERDGLLENTVIVYTSDHGDMAGIQGMWGKCVPHDPSIGVPLLMTGPGITPGHRHVESPVSLMDLFPTLCAVTGLPVPEGLDGMDLSDLLIDSDAPSPRDYATSTYMIYAVRVKGGWTLPEHEPCAAMRTVREKDWKYVEIERGDPILFDLKNDPGETKNLAALPAYAARCASMRARVFDGFSWEDAREQLARDRTRVASFASGVKPTVPNQYMLPDGRIFDAEASLYDARWLHLPSVHGGGIIPQQFG